MSFSDAGLRSLPFIPNQSTRMYERASHYYEDIAEAGYFINKTDLFLYIKGLSETSPTPGRLPHIMMRALYVVSVLVVIKPPGFSHRSFTLMSWANLSLPEGPTSTYCG
jgi:hypothetical protein